VNRFVLPALTVALFATTSLHAENWPHWRGPTYDGISTETGLPTSWSADKNIVWKLPLPGMGGSTPAIWGDRMFLTCEDGDDLMLLCIGTDGTIIWKCKLGTSTKKKYRGDEGNEASASPSTDGKHVFAFVASGDIACRDFDGKDLWHFNLQDRYGKFKIQFGLHSTPLLYQDKLYVQMFHSGGNFVVALNKADGKEAWKITRKSDGRDECEHSYASPCLWRGDKDAYLVIHGNDYTTAHKLSDGSEIWRLGDLNPKGEKYNTTFRFVASPVASGGLIVVPTCKSGPVVGVKPDASGMITIGSPAEQWRRPRNTPDVPSPLVYDGLVYLCRETGNLICVDARDGTELYEERTHNARHRASPVYADGKIYLTARDGTVSVVKTGRKFELLASNKLPDDMTASPAISGGRIYLRGFSTLYAIGQTSK
jgi:outer membrane protein assembly factor BamB